MTQKILRKDMFAKWLNTTKVQMFCDGTFRSNSCPLAKYLGRGNNVTHAYRTHGGKMTRLPAWASRFVRGFDMRTFGAHNIPKERVVSIFKEVA